MAAPPPNEHKHGLGLYDLAVSLWLIGVLVLLVVMCRTQYDPWLRLTALAMLAQGFASLFFVLDRRYLILDWYLTGLILAVWFNQPETQDSFARAWNGLLRRMPWVVRRQIA